MFRKENGVTLVALVITIIILLILAGVTISMVLGDDGIITNAQTAAENTEKSDMEAAANYANLLVRTDVIAAQNGGTASAYSAYTTENIKNAIIANSEYTDCTVSGNVITIEGDYYNCKVTVNEEKQTITVKSEAK